MKILRPALTILLTAFAQVSLSQTFLGTKAGGSTVSLEPTAAGGPGLGSFVQMVIALGIVLALVKVVVPKLAGRMNRKLVTSANSTLKIEETAHFAGGTLYIVRARSKTLLLGVNGTAISCLADISEAPPTEAPSFQEIVEAEESKPVTAAAFVPQAEVPTNDPVEIALRRLERLSS